VLPPHLIHDALERVIGSHEFSGSDRKKRFLKFIVQETLAGHANRIKAYTIAVDVFGRDPSFDPTSDPMVRIEAGRLRRCLEHYYLTAGSADEVQITIPKGGYVPQFTRRKESKPSEPSVLGDDERMIIGRKAAIIQVEAVLDQAPDAGSSSGPLPGTSLRERPRFLTGLLFLLVLLATALLGGWLRSNTVLQNLPEQPQNKGQPSWFCLLKMTAAIRRRTSMPGAPLRR
jgi:hypothetical protein